MRKGQVTIFVALGLLILLIVAIVILAQRSSEPATLMAQQEAAKVSNLVHQCLETTGEQAVRKILSQGGYASLKDLDVGRGSDSDVIHFEPQIIPMWHEVYSCENPGGCIGDNRPQLCEGRGCILVLPGGTDVSWQGSIEELIEENVVECFSEFANLPSVLVEVQKDPVVTAIIRENDVYLDLDLPLHLLTSDDQEVDLQDFSATLDIDLEQMYQLATDIYITERQLSFLEEIFLHMLSAVDGIDSPIPPMRDVQIRGGMKTWITRNVQEELETGVMPFLTFIQIPNAMESYSPLQSLNKDPNLEPYATGFYEYLSVKLGSRAYPLGVQFQYPYKTMRLDINGEEYLKGRPMPGTGFLRIIGGLSFTDYRFRYNVQFPMIVKITDPYAFNGQGADLFFGLEANIINNRPVNTSKEILTFKAPDEMIDIGSPENLVDHTYTITAQDKRTGEPISDAGIAYICGTEFTVGATNSQGVWMGKLPYCVGGYIRIEHQDYAMDAIQVDNIVPDGGSSEITIQQWPLREKKVMLLKRSEINPSPQPLGKVTQRVCSRESGDTVCRTVVIENANESAVVTLSREMQTPYDGMVPMIGIMEFGTTNSEQEKEDTRVMLSLAYNQGELTTEEYAFSLQDLEQVELETISESTIEMVPGSYEITGFLTFYGDIRIPEDKRCSLLVICSTLPGQNYTSWQNGGILLGGTDAVEFSEEFVYSDRDLVLYALELPIPATWEDLEGHESLEDALTYGRLQLTYPDT